MLVPGLAEGELQPLRRRRVGDGEPRITKLLTVPGEGRGGGAGTRKGKSRPRAHEVLGRMTRELHPCAEAWKRRCRKTTAARNALIRTPHIMMPEYGHALLCLGARRAALLLSVLPAVGVARGARMMASAGVSARCSSAAARFSC